MFIPLLVVGALALLVGLATLVLGLGVLFLDHFSEERADGYQRQIIEELEHPAQPQ